MRVIKIGDNGSDVLKVQQRLNKLMPTLNLDEDGWFGEFTKEAVKKYQAVKKLSVDGVVGYNTLKSLGLLVYSSPEWLILHCSATVERIAGYTAKSIVDFHIKTLRWGRPGYARIIEYNGEIVKTWDVDLTDGIQPFETTFGVGNWGLGAGVDAHALNVCYVGGLDKSGNPKDTRTQEQKDSMANLVHEIVKMHPMIKVGGHNQFFNKACPCFSVEKFCREIGIPEANIYKENPFGYYK